MFDLISFAAACGVGAPEHFAGRCDELYSLLSEANSKVNLTRITGYDDYLVKHVVDSLLLTMAFPALAHRKIAICDIGCGGGFPSLILALAFPEWRVCAVDSIGKKTAFVRSAAQALGLPNCEVFTGRSVELNRLPAFRRRFDVVTARAVARAAVISADARDFPRPSGGFILYKTPGQAAEDIAELEKREPKRWRVSEEFELPCAAGTRCFVTDMESRGNV